MRTKNAEMTFVTRTAHTAPQDDRSSTGWKNTPIDHMDTAVAYKLFGPPSLGGREKKSFGALRESQGERIRSQFYSLQFPFMLSLVEACRFFLTKGEKTAGQNLGGRGLNIRKLLQPEKMTCFRNGASLYSSEKGRRLVIRYFLTRSKLTTDRRPSDNDATSVAGAFRLSTREVQVLDWVAQG